MLIQAGQFLLGELGVLRFSINTFSWQWPQSKKYPAMTATYGGLSGTSLVHDRKLLFFLISASGSNYNPQNTQCIPLVVIFAFLDLIKNP